MSFDIKATARGWTYSKEDRMDDGIFTTGSILTAMSSISSPLKVTVPLSAVDAALPNGKMGALQALATMQATRLFNMNVTLFAAEYSGEIRVIATQEPWLWTNTTMTRTFKLGGHSNPTEAFLKKIGPALVATEMNNFGVLLEIGNALQDYSIKSRSSRKVNMTIRLTRSTLFG